MKYSAISESLQRGGARAALGLLNPRNAALRAYLQAQLAQAPGLPGALLGDMVFEATFGWQASSETLATLAGKLLHPRLVEALDEPHPDFTAQYRLAKTTHPYQHQLAAWRALLASGQPRSVLVSSGTGSGKTECFLLPILHDLATEATASSVPLVGVRALLTRQSITAHPLITRHKQFSGV